MGHDQISGEYNSLYKVWHGNRKTMSMILLNKEKKYNLYFLCKVIDKPDEP